MNSIEQASSYAGCPRIRTLRLRSEPADLTVNPDLYPLTATAYQHNRSVGFETLHRSALFTGSRIEVMVTRHRIRSSCQAERSYGDPANLLEKDILIFILSPIDLDPATAASDDVYGVQFIIRQMANCRIRVSCSCSNTKIARSGIYNVRLNFASGHRLCVNSKRNDDR